VKPEPGAENAQLMSISAVLGDRFPTTATITIWNDDTVVFDKKVLSQDYILLM